MKFVWVLAVLALLVLSSFIVAGAKALNMFMDRRGIRAYNDKLARSPEPPQPSPYRSHTEEWTRWWQSQPREQHSVSAADGAVLRGWAVRGSGKKVALVLHGHDCDSGSIGFITDMFLRLGYSVLVPDMRGNGESGGRFITFGALEQRDARLWLYKALQIFGDDSELVVYGNSLGGATALLLSAQNGLPGQLKCIVSDCAFTSAREMINAAGKLYLPAFALPLVLVGLGLLSRPVAHFRIADTEPLAVMPRSQRPTLFIHGGADTYVPAEMVQRLYAACRSEKALYVAPGCTHGVAFFGDPQRFEREVDGFCSRYIK